MYAGSNNKLMIYKKQIEFDLKDDESSNSDEDTKKIQKIPRFEVT